MRNNRQRRGNSSFSATVLLSLLLLLAVTCRRRGVEAFLNPLVSLDCSIGSNLSRTTTTATILRQRQNPSRSVYSYNYNNNALGRCTRNSSSRRRHHSTSRTTTTTTTTNLHAVMDIVGVSPEPIHTAFAYATFGPQPFWLLLIVLPKANITKQVMGKLDVVLFFALLHFFIVAASIAQPDSTAPLLEFNNVFDPSKDSQAAFMNMVTNYPNFVAEEWPHVLTWDLFIGRWIWLDGLKRGIFTSHSVLFSNLIGPPGLLLHWITCIVTGNGLGKNEALENEESNNQLLINQSEEGR